MASIQKTASGRYRAQIKMRLKDGEPPVRDSALFSTKREAQLWAAQREQELTRQASLGPGQLHTLRDALRQYAEVVSPTKRGMQKELLRLAAFETCNLPLDLAIADVTPQHIADFRDDRAKTVRPSSVLRDLTLLSAVFQTAKVEWRWVSTNPCREIRKPPATAHRERVLLWWEIRAILRILGHSRKEPISSSKQAVAECMILALRTGMRAGELCGLRWEHVHETYVHLPITKNGMRRNVPLSSRARRSIDRFRGWDDTYVVGVKAASLDALFRKYRGRAGLEGFTWHDTRHTAATMLAKKVDVLTLCKIFGWSNTRQALTYYNPSATDIAALLG